MNLFYTVHSYVFTNYFKTEGSLHPPCMVKGGADQCQFVHKMQLFDLAGRLLCIYQNKIKYHATDWLFFLLSNAIIKKSNIIFQDNC